MILIYPDKLQTDSKLKMILDNLKYPYTYDTSQKHDLVFNSTLAPKHTFDFKTDKFVINRHCTNVLKDFVDKRWGDIYGYNLRIDPSQHIGLCAEKTLLQGTNSGKVVKCPLDPLRDKIYLRLADTRLNIDTLHDIRVSIINGKIILVFLKKKKISYIFSNHYDFENVKATDVLTSKEIEKILEFSSFFDFGELDVVRSNFDGKIYVLDVNNLSGYGYFRKQEFVNYMSVKFKEAFL